jgi:hypothetical protein
MKNLSVTDLPSPALKEFIHVGGRNWKLSLEPELETANSIPNLVDDARAQKDRQEDAEVASQ